MHATLASAELGHVLEREKLIGVKMEQEMYAQVCVLTIFATPMHAFIG